MAVFLYVIENAWKSALGTSLDPGLTQDAIRQRDDLKQMIQGIRLELRLPDGSKIHTTLLNYGMSVYKQPDGSLVKYGEPNLRLIVPDDITPESIPAGTELWWIQDE